MCGSDEVWHYSLPNDYWCVYAPRTGQMQKFAETLTEMKCLIDNNEVSPTLIVGPLGYAHGISWFKFYPFTMQGLLLYNLLLENEMFCINSEFKQNINYTYFNADRRSYIDHVFYLSFAVTSL